MERLLNYNQLAEILGVSIKTLQFWVAAGYLPHFKLGDGPKSPVRFIESDIINWLKTRRVQGRKELINIQYGYKKEW